MTLDIERIEAELAAANMDAAGQHRRQARSWTHVRNLLDRVKVLEGHLRWSNRLLLLASWGPINKHRRRECHSAAVYGLGLLEQQD